MLLLLTSGLSGPLYAYGTTSPLVAGSMNWSTLGLGGLSVSVTRVTEAAAGAIMQVGAEPSGASGALSGMAQSAQATPSGSPEYMAAGMAVPAGQGSTGPVISGPGQVIQVSAVGGAIVSQTQGAVRAISFTGTYSTSSQNSNLTSAVPKVWWQDLAKRRSRLQIYFEVMELTKRGAMTPFEVAFYVRLNHKRAKEYMEFLEGEDLLQKVDEDGKRLYVLTKEGLAFLERARAMFVGKRLIEVRSYETGRDF